MTDKLSRRLNFIRKGFGKYAGENHKNIFLTVNKYAKSHKQ